MVKSVYVPQAGGIIDFPDEATPQQMLSYIDSTYGVQQTAAPAPEPSEGIGALESGFYGYLGRLGTAGGSISQAAGLDELSKYLFEQAKRNEEYAAKYKPEVADISEIEGVGDLASFAGSTIAQSAPDTATGIGGAYAGAAAGAALGSVVPVVGTTAGGILGGIIGGAIAALPSFIGGNLQRQAIEKDIPIEETDLSSASTGAIVQAPLDAAFDVLIARKLPGGSAALDIARKGFLKEVAKTAGRGAVTESLTEPAQQAIELAQANPEKLLEFGPDVQFEILNSAAAGALAGGVIGGAAGGFESTVTRRLAERPYRQLQEDLGREAAVNAQAQRQGEISRAAEELRKVNVEGDVEIIEDDFDGISRFTIRTPGGNTVGDFLDAAEAEEAVGIYKQRTDANITVRKPADLPSVFPVKLNGKEYQTTDQIIADRDSLVSKSEGLAAYMSRPDVIKREAERQNVSEALVRKATAEEVADMDKQIGKLNEFVAAAKPTPAADLGEGDLRSLTAKPTPQEPKGGTLNTIPYETLSWDESQKKAVRSSGESNVIDLGGRKVVIKNVNGVNVPFYLSTGSGGKKDVPAGKWYPFFGIGPTDGWINKTGGLEMASYYGSPELAAAAAELDSTVGDIRSDNSIPKASLSGAHIDFINSGLDPTDNQTPDTVKKVRANIDRIKSLVSQGKVAPEAPIGAVEAVSEEAPITEAPAVAEPVEPSEGPVETTTPEEPRPSVGQLKEAPVVRRTLSQAEAEGPILRDYNQATIDRYAGIYTALKSRLSGKVPKDVDVKLEELISTPANLLVKGRARVEKTPNGIKSIVDLSTGILRPNMTVEEAVNELVETLDHEIIHVLRDQGVIRPAEWSMLSKAAINTNVPGRKYTYLDKAQAVYTQNGQPISEIYADPDAVIEEAVAEMYKDWVKGQRAPVQIRGLFNRITEFLRSIFRVLKSDRYKDIFKAIDTGEIGARDGVGRDAMEGARFSAGPSYDPRKSTSDWETGGAPPPGISSVNSTGGSPFRISQRRPTSVKKAGASLLNNLLVDVSSMKLEPGVFEHNINIVNSYPGFPAKPGENPEQTLKRFKKHVVDNLLWLHDKMDPSLRQRAKLWYDGARKITDGLAAKYNLPDTTVAAVLAGLSPQKDWFQNVSLAERAIDIAVTKRDVPFDDSMFDYAMSVDSIAQYAPMLQAMRGMTLNDMKSKNFESFLARKHNEVLAGVFNAEQATSIVSGDATLAKSIFIRVYDEANNSRSYNIITPEGDKGAIATTGKGKPSNVAWGSFTEIGKAANAIEDGTKENIDTLLGDKHKIRNFYNNIISPNSKDGSVTIDTHAVAAALMRALAGKSVEVHHNFGTSVKGMTYRTRNSSITGVQGMYAIYADAYREAAKLRGVLPREMQSITWEAVRGLYKPRFKGQGKNVQAIDDIWRLHSNGKITSNEARKRTLELADPGAKGINSPFWKDTPSSVVYGVGGPALNTGGVRQVGLRQAAGRTGGGGTGADASGTKRTRPGGRFSAAPALNTEEFKRWFRNSKIVDSNGKPLVVYHGTQGKFKAFDTAQSELGSHFGTKNQANEFVQTPESEMSREDWAEAVKFEGRTDQIFPVYLSMQNPIRMKDTGRWIPSRIAKRLQLEGMLTPEQSKYISSLPLNTPVQIKALQKLLKESGVDGIVYLNRYEGFKPKTNPTEFATDAEDLSDEAFKAKYPEAQDSYLIFDPVQVKSIFNEFEEGAATSPRFSAAPLPPYVEAKNRTLFVPERKESIMQSIFDFFSGPATQAKTLNTVYGQIDMKGGYFGTRANINRRMSLVDKNAYIEFLEKTANEKDTGNFQRRETTQSALVALGMADRSSQLTAATVMKGPPVIEYSSPGDIQSATVVVRNDADKLIDIFRVMLEPGPVDPLTNEPRDKRVVFKSYATAMRAIGLKAAGKPVPRELDDVYINTTIQSVQRDYPEIVEAYNKYQRFNKKLITAARDAGRITDAELAKFTQQMDYYGFYREVYEEQLVPGMPSKLAGDIKIREYKGSERGELIEDPMLVILTNVNFWMGAITRNIAVNKAFKLANDMGEARLLGASEKPDLSQGESEQVMFFRENGAQKRFAVKDPMLVVSLGADDRADMGAAMKFLGMPTTALRESITRDPVFMIRNLLRDTLSSWITSGEDITPFIGTIQGYAKALNNSTSYQALVGRGVVGSHDLAMRSPAEMAAIIRRRASPKNIMNIASADGMQGLLMSAWDKLGVWSEASDAATRIAVYESAIKQGMSEAEAAFRAIEIMNFSRRGSSSFLQLLTRLVPFLNARIQGMDVLYQAGKAGVLTASGYQLGERDANLGKKFLYRGAILAALSVALEMMLDGDEDYEELPDYVKNGNLLLPLKLIGLDGYFAAVPKPFEAGLLFSTIPQELYKATTGETSGREMAKFFWSEFTSTFGLNPIPQVALPALEALVNYDFYTDLPLISEGKARLTPELQYDSRTSSVAMMLSGLPIKYNFTTGKFEGVSPIIIDQMISGYGGPMGSYLMQGVGLLMEGMGAAEDRLPRDVTQLPGIKSFLLDAESRNPKSVAQAYELFRVVDEVNRSFSRLRQTGDVEATMDYLERNKDILAYKKHIYKLFDGLNKLSARERQIERDSTMTRDEKLEAMKQLREVRARLTSNISEINKALGR